tara:strand:- start:1654 stop:1899 length:246 start_codon:yes stop_codon:yes gene_type:complete
MDKKNERNIRINLIYILIFKIKNIFFIKMNYRTHDMEEIGKTLGKSIINLNKEFGKKSILYMFGTTILISSIFYKICISIS